MSGIVFICVGRRKTGKTTYTKRMISARDSSIPMCIYDVNCEYQSMEKSKELDRMETFLDRVVLLKGHYIVFEEATIFFTPRGGAAEEMRNILVRARHTQNIIQLNFHSFSSIPKDIKNMVDYIVVFKTNDNELDVTNKFDNPKVLDAWRKAQKSINPFYFSSVSLY